MSKMSGNSNDDSPWARFLTRTGHNLAFVVFAATILFLLVGPGNLGSWVLTGVFTVQGLAIIYICLYRLQVEHQSEQEKKRRAKEESEAERKQEKEKHCAEVEELRIQREFLRKKQSLELERMQTEIDQIRQSSEAAKELKRIKTEQERIAHENAVAQEFMRQTKQKCLDGEKRLKEQHIRWQREDEARTKQKARGQFDHLPIPIGTSADGREEVLDLLQDPHLFLGGATGQGKSVLLHGVISSLITRYTPDQVKLILINTKLAEFSAYGDIPHLLWPIITGFNKSLFVFSALQIEIARRIQLLQQCGCRTLEEYIGRAYGKTEYPPQIIVIVDELYLAGVDCDDVITAIEGLVQTTTAMVGVHIIVATQCATVGAIKQLLKTGAFSRAVFKVTSRKESNVCLGRPGAERLANSGDLLFRRGTGEPVQLRSRDMTQDDIVKAVRQAERLGTNNFDDTVTRRLERIKACDSSDCQSSGDSD